jgi:hypothetical protein
MKAILVDGNIKLFKVLPRTWKHHDNFRKASVELLEAEGFLEVLIPEYDTELQKLSEIYKDEANNLYTYDVVDLEIDIDTERARKIKEFETIVEGEMMDALKIGVLEKIVLGESVPQETKDKVTALRERETAVVTLMNQITDPKALRKFRFDRTEIEADKAILKSARKI